MRLIFLSILLTAISAAQEDGSVVRFSNGDQLLGQTVSLSVDSLSWKSPVLARPAEFDLRNVVDLRMAQSSELEMGLPAGHEAILEMTNGDVFRGKLAGLSDEEIRLQTWYAGELAFRRVNVEQVRIKSGGKVIYRGPSGMNGWTRSDNRENWSFKAGKLHSSGPGGLAREVDFTDAVSISFTAEWRGNFRPKFLFFTNDLDTVAPNVGLALEFQGNSVHVRNLAGNELIGRPSNVQTLRNVERAKFEIQINKKTGEILLFVDRELMAIWEDSKLDMSDFGNGFHIVSQDNTRQRFSEIKISEWDGYVDDDAKRVMALQENIQFRNRQDFGVGNRAESAEGKIEEGRMIFHNGDSIKGEVTKIDGDDITVKTAFSEVKFPLARLRNLVLKKADMETPKRNRGDVRATLVDGSKVVFRLDGVKDGRLQGFSQNFGSAEFQENAFKQIEFNIYDKRMDQLRVAEDW